MKHIPHPILHGMMISRFVYPEAYRNNLDESHDFAAHEARLQDQYDQAFDSCVLSSLMLEAQLAAIPASRTAQPKASRRIFLDATIPRVHPITLLAWQSLCEIASGSVFMPGDVSRLASLYDSTADARLPHPPMFPIHHRPMTDQNMLLYWTLIQNPTLGDGSQETHIPGSIQASTPFLKDLGGYGHWSQSLLRLWGNTEGWFWDTVIVGEQGEDTSVIAENRLYRGLVGLGEQYAREVATRLSLYWRHPANLRMNSWKVPAAFPLATRTGKSRFELGPAWGVNLLEPPHHHFYRLMKDHEIGMRFDGQPKAWLESWKHSVEFQIKWAVLQNMNPPLSDATFIIGQRLKESEAHYIQMRAELDSFLKTIQPPEPLSAELDLNIESIKDTLGI